MKGLEVFNRKIKTLEKTYKINMTNRLPEVNKERSHYAQQIEFLILFLINLKLKCLD